MDAFEDIVAWRLEQEGYWVRRSYKVKLSKGEKRQTRRPSLPRADHDYL